MRRKKTNRQESLSLQEKRKEEGWSSDVERE
jgi:hypothetical protein